MSELKQDDTEEPATVADAQADGETGKPGAYSALYGTYDEAKENGDLGWYWY